VFKNYEGRTFRYPLTATPVKSLDGAEVVEEAEPVKLPPEFHG